MKIETYLYLGNWTELENFVRYKLPHNEDLCFFSTGDIANPKTYIVFRESKFLWIIKQYFQITPAKIDKNISYKNWIFRGNKNLLPEDFLVSNKSV